MKKYALIVAGGSGSRMKSLLPKQFIEINGLPILMHTMLKFDDQVDEIILVLPETDFITWENLTQKYNFKIKHKIAKGGQTRIESVQNGLDFIPNEPSLVAIHDGVRPFVHLSIIRNSFEVALKKGNAVVTVPLKDSIRQITENGNQSLDRNQFRLIQTPQTFQTQLIKKAYKQQNINHLTDDASVAENMGLEIHLIEGDYQNIKITTPEDLIVAKAFLDMRYEI